VAVNPGPVRTERWAGLVDAMARDMKIPREEADMLAPRSIPLGRIAECEEVASLVTYLASDLAHFVNGTWASDPPHRVNAWSKARPTIARTRSRRYSALA
jgi:NAD(P)-dependent dehydrogenase (short-subunit alcohol dehydrogenase family)